MKNTKPGIVIHIMGYHKSGKKTLCDILFEKISQLTTKNITYIDEDIKRKLSYGLKHNTKDRKIQFERIGYISNEIIKNRGLVIFCSSYPFYRERESIREKADKNGNKCFNIFLDTPLSICKERDRDGIYVLAKTGKIKNIPGVDEVFENPDDFDLILDDIDVYINIETIIEKIQPYL